MSKSTRPVENMNPGKSLNAAEDRQAFVAARKRAANAGAWKYNQGYEDGLAAIERDPAVEFTLSGHHRSCLGYYREAKLDAQAEGIDTTGGSR